MSEVAVRRNAWRKRIGFSFGAPGCLRALFAGSSHNLKVAKLFAKSGKGKTNHIYLFIYFLDFWGFDFSGQTFCFSTFDFFFEFFNFMSRNFLAIQLFWMQNYSKVLYLTVRPSKKIKYLICWFFVFVFVDLFSFPTGAIDTGSSFWTKDKYN